MSYKKWSAALLTVGVLAALSGCAQAATTPTAAPQTGQKLTILIGSSGDAETKAVQAAASAWGTKSGNTVNVVAASDLTQQLSQGFAGGSAPDLFYMSWDQFGTYASNGYLEPYAANLPNASQFYKSLTDTFTYKSTFTCAPKDFSTLGLIINTDMWKAAGLTDADIPTDWTSLEAAAKKLTTATTVGLSFGLEYARAGVFMNQAGGKIIDGTKAVADSPENLAGLQYIQKLHGEGVLKWPSEVSAGWSGEALGAGKAAMVIEGPWIKGIKTDFPNTKYQAYELPAGPGGKSTFSFTNCWGIPANSKTASATVDLVKYLTADDQQLAFADAFGVIPSTQTGAAAYATKFPENASFVKSNDYAVSPVNFAGSATVISDFNSQLAGLIGGDAKTILATFQTNLQAALDTANSK